AGPAAQSGPAAGARPGGPRVRPGRDRRAAGQARRRPARRGGPEDRRAHGRMAGRRLSGRAVDRRPPRPGRGRYIVDYFLEEVLTRQSAQTVRFLLRTSVLERICGSLCDAVLDTTGSAAWLNEVQGLNLFIIPEDDQGEWYRYHRLFAEMLQSELRRREPGEEARVQR